MKRRAFVFGTGMIYEMIRPVVAERFEIVALFDNNPSKWNTSLDGIVILDPSGIRGAGADVDVVIVAASHIAEISRQLVELGIPRARIEVGANYIFSERIPAETGRLHYTLDDECNPRCSFAKSDAALVTMDLPGGRTILVDTKNIPALIAYYENDSGLIDFFRLAARHNEGRKGLFVDVGANIGTTSLRASDHPDVTGCYAFEPYSANYALLMSNIHLNRLHGRIIGVNRAIGERTETKQLFISPVCAGDNRIREADAGADFHQSHAEMMPAIEEVGTVALDDFFHDRIDEIGFLWIDVQGYEYFVLSGCRKLIANRSTAIQIEYWPRGLDETRTRGALNRLLAENFSGYIDMNDPEGPSERIHPIDDIHELAPKLLRVNPNLHTDLFLIR